MGGGAQDGSAEAPAADGAAADDGAQDRGGPPDGNSDEVGNEDHSDGGGAESGGDEGSSPTDLDSARVNFATVVEAYVAKNSPDGYWPYTEKKDGQGAKIRRLTLPAVVEESVKQEADGRFSGLVKMSDARGGRPCTLEFVVDFSGVKWKVVSVKPRPRRAGS